MEEEKKSGGEILKSIPSSRIGKRLIFATLLGVLLTYGYFQDDNDTIDAEFTPTTHKPIGIKPAPSMAGIDMDSYGLKLSSDQERLQVIYNSPQFKRIKAKMATLGEAEKLLLIRNEQVKYYITEDRDYIVVTKAGSEEEIAFTLTGNDASSLGEITRTRDEIVRELINYSTRLVGNGERHRRQNREDGIFSGQ